MIANPALAWAFTAWFAVLGLVSLAGIVRSAGWVDRGSYGAHVLMCLAMATMPWSWSTRVPAGVTITVFTLAAAWYAWLALFRPHADAGPGGGGHHSSTLLLAYHTVMMAAMVWMSVVMTAMMAAPGGMAAMSAMPAPGTSTGAAAMPDPAPVPMAATASVWHLAPWQVAVTVAFVAVFAAATAWFAVRLRTGPSHPTGHRGLPSLVETLLSLAMALGMGASFLVMS